VTNHHHYLFWEAMKKDIGFFGFCVPVVALAFSLAVWARGQQDEVDSIVPVVVVLPLSKVHEMQQFTRSQYEVKIREPFTEEDVAAMVRLAWRESRFDPEAQNPRTTAFGMYQFLDSTWHYYGVEKTSDPFWQTVAAIDYIIDRYGAPVKALAFHRQNRWY